MNLCGRWMGVAPGWNAACIRVVGTVGTGGAMGIADSATPADGRMDDAILSEKSIEIKRKLRVQSSRKFISYLDQYLSINIYNDMCIVA